MKSSGLSRRRMECFGLIICFAINLFGNAEVGGATHYVNATNPTPFFPYTTWSTAAQRIQLAINVASAGSTVLVAAGTYNIGSTTPAGAILPTRVLVNKSLTLKGVDGAARTIIVGGTGTGWNNCGDTAIRCVAVTASNVRISGFTFQNGHTRTNGTVRIDECGGGVWVATSLVSVVITDCIFTNCGSYQDGGGAWGGEYSNCEFRACTAWNGGGAAYCVVMGSRFYGCTAPSAGGGMSNGKAYDSEFFQNMSSGSGGGAGLVDLYRCTLRSNSASYGGGLYGGKAYSCWFVGNYASLYGGGAQFSTLLNCTLVDNRAGTACGGGDRSGFTNCIIWSNSAPIYANVGTNCTGRYNCTWFTDGMAPWPNTITTNPSFRERYYNKWPILKGDSTCINAGTNYSHASSENDLLRRKRVLYRQIDLGACEYVATLNDYDCDGRSDLTTWRQQGTDWRMWTWKSGSGAIERWWTTSAPPGLLAVPFLYSSNAVFEPVCYREATGDWYAFPFTNSTRHGGPGMVPVWGDYDGDGVWDGAVYERASGKWYIMTTTGAILAWGLNWGYNGAVPVPGDYNGDGCSDLAVYDLSTGSWYIRTMAGAVLAWNRQWGYQGAIPVSGDYNGDGGFDLCVFDRTTGRWYITGVNTNSSILVWGWPWGYYGTRPVPGDFDGDGEFDLAVFDVNTAVWYVREITSSAPLYWNTYVRPGVAVGMVTW